VNFLNAIGLWGGLAAAGVAIPVLLHLLSRRKHRDLDWAAMDLLKRALRNRSRQLKIENWLLMLLRCAALALIALAMARPFYHDAPEQWAQTQRQTGTVIAIDASYSMMHRTGTQRFDTALALAQQLAQSIREDEPVSLITMASQPRVLLRNVPFSPDRFAQALADLQATHEPLVVSAQLPLLRELADELTTPRKRCVIITDAQARDWATLNQDASAQLQALGEACQLHVLSVDRGGAANLAISELEHMSGRLVKAGTARFAATVVNMGTTASAARDLEFIVDGRVVQRRRLASIAPNESASVTAYLRMPRGGDVPITARLAADALPVDDVRHLVVAVSQNVRVLLVDGAPSRIRFASETAFLQAALRSADAMHRNKSLRWTTITPNKLAVAKLDSFDVLMLANSPGVSASVIERVRKWVDRGGGLMIFTGDQVDARAFNDSWNTSDRWMPATFGPVSSIDPTDDLPSAIEAALPGHRLSRVLESLPLSLTASTTVRQFMELQPVADAQVVWRMAGSGVPMLVERSEGRGRVLMFASTADRDWTDLPVFPMFPLLIHEAVTHLTTPRRVQPYAVGQFVRMPIEELKPNHPVTVIDPTGRKQPVQAARDQDGMHVPIADTTTPGFYRIKPKGRPSLVAAVNVDIDESDLRPMTDAHWQATLAEIPATVSNDLAAGELAGAAPKSRELWRYVLVAALAFLLIEALLGRRYVKRGRAESPEQAEQTDRAHLPAATGKAVA
jgi:hypothetical protein